MLIVQTYLQKNHELFSGMLSDAVPGWGEKHLQPACLPACSPSRIPHLSIHATYPVFKDDAAAPVLAHGVYDKSHDRLFSLTVPD